MATVSLVFAMTLASQEVQNCKRQNTEGRRDQPRRTRNLQMYMWIVKRSIPFSGKHLYNLEDFIIADCIEEKM